VIFWRILAAKKWNTMKWMEIDQDYLQTGTATGSRSCASHEHQLRFLVCTCNNVKTMKIYTFCWHTITDFRHIF